MAKPGCIIGFLFVVILVLASAVVILALRDPELSQVLFTKELPADTSNRESRTVQATNNGEAISSNHEKGFNQYFDAHKAFAKDTLFAMTDKQIVPDLKYTDRFDKNIFGHPKEKTHPPVYTIRFLGRETRENYIFVVPRKFYDSVQLHQKFTNAELSSYEFYLSEEKLHQEIFHRRFRQRMID